VLNVLRPLIAQDETEVRKQGPDWTREIRTMPAADQPTQEQLLDLLVQFIVQKFRHLERKEIEKMLQLTPIEETQFYQDVVHEGHISLLAEQIEQKFGVPVEESTERLAPLEVQELKQLARYLVTAEQYIQVEAWIEGRLTPQSGD
jgi:predicted transposase YdaD